MSVYEKICDVKNILESKISERAFYGYAMPQAYARRAYEDALTLVISIEKEYNTEYCSKNSTKNIKIAYHFDCLERDFVIEISEIFGNIAYKIIEESYLYWCESPDELNDICCEDYINQRLIYYGLEYKVKK